MSTPWSVPAQSHPRLSKPRNIDFADFNPVVPSDRSARSIESAELRQIVERIYRSGYKLDADDPRLEDQLALIPAGEIRLLAWPPETS
jgi:hypothetical protein